MMQGMYVRIGAYGALLPLLNKRKRNKIKFTNLYKLVCMYVTEIKPLHYVVFQNFI